MRVVALVSGGIGDQVLFFPTIDTLARRYPDAQIDVVAEPRSKAAYRVSKSVSEVLTFDWKDRNSLADWGNLVGTIRDREYDIAITLEQSWAVGLILWLTGIPNRIGFQGKGSGFLTSEIPINSNQYIASTYHDLLKGLGINSPCPELTLNVPSSDIEWANNEQKRLGVKDTGYVLIYGTGSKVTQDTELNNIYPPENWLQIIKNFQLKQPDMPIVAVTLKDSEELVRTLKESAPNLKVTAPDNVGKLAAMIASANLMICTDSYPMHLSVAVQTFTVALFGVGDNTKLLPTKNDKFLAIKSPTGKMADIPSQTVLDKIWGG